MIDFTFLASKDQISSVRLFIVFTDKKIASVRGVAELGTWGFKYGTRERVQNQKNSEANGSPR